MPEELKRELGLWEVTISGIGVILGAGIYTLIGKAAGMAGNSVWMSFLFGAIIAAVTGLSYIELSTMYPKAGGEYTYTNKAFGRFPAFLVGWIILIGGVFSVSTVAIGFGGYFSALFGTGFLLPAGILILACCALLCWGVKMSVRVDALFTLIEVAGLLIIIAIGLPHLGSVNMLAAPDLSNLLGATALIFFAYIGFEQISRLAEDTREPRKTIPKAMVLSLAITSVVYVLVALAAVSVLDAGQLAVSKAPIADVAATVMGSQAFTTLAVIALFSTANTVLLFLLAASRVLYGMGRDSALPKLFGNLHKSRRTPWLATMVIAALAMVAILPGKIELAANLTNYAVFLSFIIINFAVICLRFTRPHDQRGFRIPLNIGRVPLPAVFGIVVNAAMLAGVGWDVLFYGTVMLALGGVVWLGLRKPFKSS